MALQFDVAFLTKLERLRIVSTRAVAGHGRGDRRSRTRGRGLEFADYRQYAQGDDFRHIDWKAYKRLNRLLVRLFDEDQDLPIYLLLDASRSMDAHGKFEHARRIAAALCYIGLAHLDRVTILPFDDHLNAGGTGGRGRHTMARVLDSLEHLTAERGTDLWQAMSEFSRRVRRQGLAVVISDFLDPAGYERALKLLTSRRHDVFVIHVTAQQDVGDASLLGEVCLVDAETGDLRTVDVTPAMFEAHARAWAAHASSVEACCARSRAGYIRAPVEDTVEHVILDSLRTGRFLE